VGGTVLVAAVFNLVMAVADYSPARPGPNPTAGFLLAGFTVSMFVSSGVWGAVAPILPPKVAVGGALMTGALLFLAVATLGFLVPGDSTTVTEIRAARGECQSDSIWTSNFNK
jgi:hypothetical protein